MVEFTCMICGAKSPGIPRGDHWIKPAAWYQRGDADGVQLTCSSPCFKEAEKRTGKSPITAQVLLFPG